jgi:hypothetical protein
VVVVENKAAASREKIWVDFMVDALARESTTNAKLFMEYRALNEYFPIMPSAVIVGSSDSDYVEIVLQATASMLPASFRIEICASGCGLCPGLVHVPYEKVRKGHSELNCSRIVSWLVYVLYKKVRKTLFPDLYYSNLQFTDPVHI